MYIYVLFNILDTFIFIIIIFTKLWAILLTMVKNEKHVKSIKPIVKVIAAKRVNIQFII